MQIEFYKTGARSYSVKILREKFSDLEMNPAPGFDDLLPHDMCHLIVEQVLRIENAIFGQIAKGGTAGSFRTVAADVIDKNETRKRRKDRKKGKDIAKQNLEDLSKSERATYICWQNWLAHSGDEKLRQKSVEMKAGADSIFKQMSADERAVYSEENLFKVRAKMDELSQQWRKLEVGQSMSVDW